MLRYCTFAHKAVCSHVWNQRCAVHSYVSTHIIGVCVRTWTQIINQEQLG